MDLISNFKEGVSIDLPLLVSSVDKKKTKAGKDYYDITVRDSSGTIGFKIWSNQIQYFDSLLEQTKILQIKAVVGSYAGVPQLEVENIVLPSNLSDLSEEDFVHKGPLNSEQMKAILEESISLMKNEQLKKMTTHFLEKYLDVFLYAPAAKGMHHNYYGGLGYHTLSMLDSVLYYHSKYENLNKDLLIAGTILHDLGKVIEYEFDDHVTDISVSKTGSLTGHISIMSNLLYAYAEKEGLSKTEEFLLLNHMILSHHGQKDWGSPVTPVIPEAFILHMVDNIDAKMDAINTAMSGLKPGDFSEKIFAMSGSRFYKSNM